MEALLLLIYAWNCAPVVGTDISRSLIVTGREWRFPIDYSTSKHFELSSTPPTVVSYAKNQAKLLEASRQIAKLLIEEQRTMHREYINANRPAPRTYKEGDIVFARRTVRSDSGKGRVGKLMYAFTGPWKIVEVLKGGSYRIQHLLQNNRFDKKHAAYLSHTQNN
jgi:hypothetical protein